MLPEQKLDALLDRQAVVERELASGVAGDAYVKLSREFAELDPVVEAIKAYRAVDAEIADLDGDDRRSDDRHAKCARWRRPSGRPSTSGATQARAELRLALLPKDAMDEHNVILEIRAGTGGDEASLFAGDLFRMYERYAAKQGWKTEIVSHQRGHQGRLQGNRRGGVAAAARSPS